MIKYHAFAKVIELGCISKAAATLGYSQPGLSHILRSFEKELGFPLLVRTNDSIQPTENGKKILGYCYQLIETENNLKETVASINGILSGTIRIGAPNSLLVGFVPDLISKFTALYPNVELFVRENTLLETQKNLQNGSIDIAFLTDTISGTLKFYPLLRDSICLAIYKDHPLSEYEKIPVSLLAGCDFIMQMQDWNDIANIVLKNQNFIPNIKHHSASDAASFAMVANNMGVYIISKLQGCLLPKNIVIREFEEEFHRTVGICIKSINGATPIQKEFIKFAQNSLLSA